MNRVDNTQELKTMLDAANRHLATSRVEGALRLFDQILETDRPLAGVRARCLAEAHIGRAAAFVLGGDHNSVDDEVMLASMIYTMLGDQQMGERVAELAAQCEAALETRDEHAIHALRQIYDNARWVGVEPPHEAVAMLAFAVLNAVSEPQYRVS